MGQRTVVQAAAFPDADALKRALKQNLSHLAQLGTTWHNLASHWAWTALISDVIDAWERLGKVVACSRAQAKRLTTCPNSTGRQVVAKGQAFV